MRYRELYEMIDMGLLKAAIAFPMSENLKEFFVTQAVNKIGTTVVLKKRVTTISATSTKVLIDADDINTKVYKVEDGEKNLPFISEENVNPNTLETTITNNAWYVKQGDGEGDITSITPTDATDSVNTFVWTLTNGSAPIDSTRVKFSEIAGLAKAGEKQYFNGKDFQMATASATGGTYTSTGVNLSGTGGYSAHTASTGVWEDKSYYMHFLKNPGSDVKIYYYANPRAMTSIDSEVDLPDELISAVSHYVLGRALATDGQLQMASGHKGLAMQIIGDWVQARSRREQYPDIIPQPLTDFIYK